MPQCACIFCSYIIYTICIWSNILSWYSNKFKWGMPMNADEEMVPGNVDVDASYPDTDPDAF